jgi:hypothetical protein
MAAPTTKGQHRAQQQGDHTDQTGFACLGRLHLEGGATMAKSRSIAPPIRTDAAEERHVRQALVATGLRAAPIGQREADHDGDGRSMDAAEGQPARDLPETRTMRPTMAKAVTRPLWAAAFSRISSMVFTPLRRARGCRAASGRRRFVFRTLAAVDQCNGDGAESHRADGGQQRDRAAAQGRTMSCWAAMATTTGMYIAPQYSTPSSVSLGRMSLLPCRAGEDEQQHRDAHAADVGLDAQCLPEQVAEEDAEQVADASSAVP